VFRQLCHDVTKYKFYGLTFSQRFPPHRLQEAGGITDVYKEPGPSK